MIFLPDLGRHFLVTEEMHQESPRPPVIEINANE
jgi:hypothetical protein